MVTYNYNGATGGNTSANATGTYNFVGWTKEVIYGSTYGTLPSPEKKFVVTYNYNGATGGNTSANATGTYNFVGWYKESTFNTQVTAGTQVTIANNHTLYAKWTGGGITLPTPTRTGYTFEYWCSDSGLSNKVGAGGATYTPTSNVTLYAKWKLNNYTISYNANGGSGSMPTDTVGYNSSYTIRNNTFTRAGYSFKGWNERADGAGKDWTSYIGKATTWTYTKNITLYAIWNPKPKVTYNYNGATTGNTEKTKEVLYGSTYGTLPSPGKKFMVTYNYNGATGGNTNTSAISSYNFGGWYKEITLNTQVTANTQVTTTSNHTLYAKWTGGGITLPTPSRTGYTFEYWCSDSGLSNKVGAGGTTYNPTSNITLYAKWRELPKYTITYNKNTTSAVSNMPGNQTKTHGISTTYNPTSNITLYAKWRELPKYTITYNKNTTSAVSNMPGNQTKTHGISINLSNTIPSRSGYTFQGWSASATQTGSGEYQPGAAYTKDTNITLYAVWKINIVVSNTQASYTLPGGSSYEYCSSYKTEVEWTCTRYGQRGCDGIDDGSTVGMGVEYYIDGKYDHNEYYQAGCGEKYCSRYEGKTQKKCESYSQSWEDGERTINFNLNNKVETNKLKLVWSGDSNVRIGNISIVNASNNQYSFTLYNSSSSSRTGTLTLKYIDGNEEITINTWTINR